MFDAKDALKAKARAVRPRDAATLILVRQSGALPQVLMGRRPDTMKFMPGKFVFPGGRLDRADHHVAPITPLRPEVQARASIGTTPSRAAALALAAIRETFEETGLVVGAQGTMARPPRHKIWSAYADAGAVPDLSGLTLIARAVTPPYRDRRFDTRFFMGTDAMILTRITASHAGELLEPRWVTFAEARELDLPTITRVVIDEAERRLPDLTQDAPCPYFRFLRGRAHQTTI